MWRLRVTCEGLESPEYAPDFLDCNQSFEIAVLLGFASKQNDEEQNTKNFCDDKNLFVFESLIAHKH